MVLKRIGHINHILTTYELYLSINSYLYKLLLTYVLIYWNCEVTMNNDSFVINKELPIINHINHTLITSQHETTHNAVPPCSLWKANDVAIRQRKKDRINPNSTGTLQWCPHHPPWHTKPQTATTSGVHMALLAPKPTRHGAIYLAPMAQLLIHWGDLATYQWAHTPQCSKAKQMKNKSCKPTGLSMGIFDCSVQVKLALSSYRRVPTKAVFADSTRPWWSWGCPPPHQSKSAKWHPGFLALRRCKKWPL